MARASHPCEDSCPLAPSAPAHSPQHPHALSRALGITPPQGLRGPPSPRPPPQGVAALAASLAAARRSAGLLWSRPATESVGRTTAREAPWPYPM
eukprot:scaffold634_cov401-Prasinococcus_capsulatus_cf.AAC.4